jgi:hypothetical protein
MSKDKFYQVHLYSKAVLEIFQNVFYHKVITDEHDNIGIEIKYSSCKNEGACTVSFRPTKEVYDIKLIDEPEFEPQGPNPGNKKIIMYGKGKTITYNPDTHTWE